MACEVFTRINTGGKTLTVFEIMVAKTYDEKKKFDLAEKYDELCDGEDEGDECLAAAKFDTISEAVIMQCVAAIKLRAVRGRDILKIRREDFIANWEPMKTALFMAIDFIRSELRVPVSQLLPYPAAVVPFTYFFHSTGKKAEQRASAVAGAVLLLAGDDRKVQGVHRIEYGRRFQQDGRHREGNPA